MMQINVSSNISAVAIALDAFGKNKIPEAASKALNGVAAKAALDVLREKSEKVFKGGATAYTKRGFLYRKSTTKKLIAEVFVEQSRAEYIRFMVDGGTRFPDRRKIMVPTYNTRLNKFGNIRRGDYAKMINDRKKFFSGIPKGFSGDANLGIWERYGRSKKFPGGRKIRMVAKYIDRAQYRPIFPFAETTQGVVFSRQDGFAVRFNKNLSKALRSARKK